MLKKILKTRPRMVVSSVLIALLLGLSGCGGEADRTELLLGTVCQIRVWGAGETDLNAAFKRLREIEAEMSRHLPGSDLFKLKPGDPDGVRVSENTCRVVRKALDFSRITGGLFDISIAPVVDLWGFGTEDAKVPSPEELKDLLALVDYRRVKVLDDCRIVIGSGQSIDLGAIAKGYASDEAARVLEQAGVDGALINLGGNVFTLGRKKDGSPWKLGIQDPLGAYGSTVGYVENSGGAVVTSGIYERFIEINGRKYHHILDPNTGYPVENNLAGVSIMGPSGLDADALSTAVFLLGIDKGCDLLKSFPNTGAVFITKDKMIVTYGTASSAFHPTNSDYTVTGRR